ncbi:hypothetical protein D9756_003129 [Leucocoprinus leucothites]|uniref:Nitrogen permease regulator 3 n=1 Tax=Leucocoprinus leucothites TaxID=201217 RepID=A0A8H5G755_9AGAR|nr:hypothetical protein D9756_003129 [Leucoagaricus leucothites]
MAESLLAILLVNSSAKGPALVYRWPPLPVCSPRLNRTRPDDGSWPSQLDNPWRASHTPEALKEQTETMDEHSYADDPEYRWQRPVVIIRPRSPSMSDSTSPHSPERSFSPPIPELTATNEYDNLFGYQVDFLASLLSPHQSMCHQKFELLVDDLAFIGHPVHVDNEGKWVFKSEKGQNHARGREANASPASAKEGSEASSVTQLQPEDDGWLQSFHLVFVCDLPDPSSSASGNLFKYFEIIYEQAAFPTTAVLFQEQVLNNFVEKECDKMGSIKDLTLSEGHSYTDYARKCLEGSSIASAMKDLYEAIKGSKIASLRINDFPLEVQLPPYLDGLLHNEDETEIDYLTSPDEEDSPGWGPEMSFGWRLPTLAPWKSLLMLDDPKNIGGGDFASLKGPYLTQEDRIAAEGLARFLDIVSVTLSLADMASLLDWDLEAQIYPVVRWLVYHRRAKIVDTIHMGLKTAFTVPPRFDQPLSVLTAEFANDFNHPAIPSLPRILAVISSSMSKQTENHFYACFVKTKELITVFQDVVIWLLKRDLLVALHLRVRVVAPPDLKLRVQLQRERLLARKKAMQRGKDRRGSQVHDELDPQELGGLAAFPNPGLPWLSLSPKHTSNRLPSVESSRSEISELVIEEDEDEDYDDYGGEGDQESESDLNDLDGSSWETEDDKRYPSIINDPARATPIQRRWLSAMSEGKDPYVAKRFEQINQYFDGKRSDDEILYRAEITRKQLREVLHHYEEYLQTFLHPS